MSAKRHNIIIERWAGNPGPRSSSVDSGFRWTVTYEKDGLFQVQGFSETHADARAAAEACLLERGIDLNWLPKSGASGTVIKPRSKRAKAI